MENIFEDALKQERSKLTEGEKMKEIVNKPVEDMNMGSIPVEEVAIGTYSFGTTRELLQDPKE